MLVGASRKRYLSKLFDDESGGRPFLENDAATAAITALSAAAGLAMGKTAGTPAALIRGFDWEATDDTSAAAMLRPAERDLFL